MLNQEDPRDHLRFYRTMTPSRRMVTGLARALLPFFMRIQASGVDHIPTQGAAVLAANHLTNWDVFPLQVSLPRPIFFMAKAELFQTAMTSAFFRRMGGFPVQRGKKDAWALAYAADLLSQGYLLGMFPEGTRSKGRGLRPAKTGAARLAIAAGCPIIPIAITGTHQVLKAWPRRTEVKIQVLPPIEVHPTSGAVALTDQVMAAIANALPAALQGVYASAYLPGYAGSKQD